MHEFRESRRGIGGAGGGGCCGVRGCNLTTEQTVWSAVETERLQGNREDKSMLKLNKNPITSPSRPRSYAHLVEGC